MEAVLAGAAATQQTDRNGRHGPVMVIDLSLNHCFSTSMDTAAPTAERGGLRLKEMRR